MLVLQFCPLFCPTPIAGNLPFAYWTIVDKSINSKNENQETNNQTVIEVDIGSTKMSQNKN